MHVVESTEAFWETGSAKACSPWWRAHPGANDCSRPSSQVDEGNPEDPDFCGPQECLRSPVEIPALAIQVNFSHGRGLSVIVKLPGEATKAYVAHPAAD